MELDLLIELIGQEAYRHGQGYGECMIYRCTGRYQYKNPIICTSYQVERLPIDTHRYLESVYKHAFRAGQRQSTRINEEET